MLTSIMKGRDSENTVSMPGHSNGANRPTAKAARGANAATGAQAAVQAPSTRMSVTRGNGQLSRRGASTSQKWARRRIGVSAGGAAACSGAIRSPS